MRIRIVRIDSFCFRLAVDISTMGNSKDGYQALLSPTWYNIL